MEEVGAIIALVFEKTGQAVSFFNALLEKIYVCMQYEQAEIIMDEELRTRQRPIGRMPVISENAGL